MFPKVVAFEASGVLFSKIAYEDGAGGSGALPASANTVELKDSELKSVKITDKSTVIFPLDVSEIVKHALQNGARVAVVSTQSQDKEPVEQALRAINATDPNSNEQRSIWDFATYKDFVDGAKTKTSIFTHILDSEDSKLNEYTYKDIIYFDNGIELDPDLLVKDVTIHGINTNGLTWGKYVRGITAWREKRTDPKNVLKISHFNDVYLITDQKKKINGKEEIINVSKFSTLLSNLRKRWKEDGIGEGLTLFSGDIFASAPECTITKGKCMTPVINTLKIDAAVAGNHEFDHGYHQMKELMGEMEETAWLFSNTTFGSPTKYVEPMIPYKIFDRAGIRIGLIGLTEKEWIPTTPGWDTSFNWQPMAEVGKKLSETLRGEMNCDLVFALTHSRYERDIQLAKDLYAYAPMAGPETDSLMASNHGVDLILGGHDHEYWVSKGLEDAWKGYELIPKLEKATKEDYGGTLILNSGTDFQDLSEITITLKDAPPGSVRKKIIGSISGIRHITRGDLVADPQMQEALKDEFSFIEQAQKDPICTTTFPLDATREIRWKQESALGNWIADSLRPLLNDSLKQKGLPPVDCALIGTGGIGPYDKIVKPGNVSGYDLQCILPRDDPVVVLEMTAADLRTAMNAGFSRINHRAGRFPAISGFRVEWDSSNPSEERYDRVKKMWLPSQDKVGADEKPILVNADSVINAGDSPRKYYVLTGEFMADGNDGYDILKNQKRVLEVEVSKYDLIQKMLLGLHIINRKGDKLKTVTVERGYDKGFSFGRLIAAAVAVIVTLGYDISSPPTTARTPPELLALRAALSEDLSEVDGYEQRRRRRRRNGLADRVIAYLTSLFVNYAIILELGRTISKAWSAGVGDSVVPTKTLPVISSAVDGRMKAVEYSKEVEPSE